MPPCLIGMEACVGAHHLSRKLQSHGHDPRLMPAKYVRPYSKGQKNDFRDGEAIAEAVQRPTMKFVPPRLSTNSTCRRCTACENDWSASAPVSSTRFVPSCWSAELRCARTRPTSRPPLTPDPRRCSTTAWVGDARAAPPNPFTLSALPPPTASHLKSPAAHARRTDPPPTERSCRRLQVDFMP